MTPAIVVQTPERHSPRAWLRRLLIPVILTAVGFRTWTHPAEIPPAMIDWILRWMYVVMVPIAWWQAIRRPRLTAAPSGPHDNDS